MSSALSWLGSFSEINKRIAAFLINRYLGSILREKVCLHQLTINVGDGIGHISDVAIDADVVNKHLDEANCPVRLIDGYIGKIDIKIPRQELLSQSCELKITKLQILVEPNSAKIDALDQNEMMNSMVESMIHSMATSMDLARSMQEEMDPSEINSYNGIDNIASIIDAVLNRMKINLFDTTLRIEFDGAPVAQAVEALIDHIEIVDKQLEYQRENNIPIESIVTQPHSLNVTPSINKVIEINGVQLFIDEFTRPDTSIILENGSAVSSMYIRRQKRSFGSENGTHPPSPSIVTSTADFQSCYSTLPPDLSIYYQRTTCSNSANITPQNVIMSHPVLVAKFGKQTQKIYVRVESHSCAKNPNKVKINIEMHFDNLLAVCNPRQLVIMRNLFSSIFKNVETSPPTSKVHERQMSDIDYCNIGQQLMSPSPVAADSQRGNSLGQNTWSSLSLNDDGFYATSSKLPNTRNKKMEFVNIDIKEDANINELPATRKSEESNDHEETDVIHSLNLKIALATLWLSVLLETDHKETNELINARNEDFFSKASNILVSSDFNKITNECDVALPFHQLRILACPVSIQLNKRVRAGNKYQPQNHIRISMAHFQCLEVFIGDSFDHSTIIDFANDVDSQDYNPEPDIVISVSNEQDLSHYAINLELNACKADLDYSLADRLFDLISAFELNCSTGTSPNQCTDRLLPINTNLLANKASDSTFNFSLTCPKLQLDIKIPIADCRSVLERVDYHCRNIHAEYISVELENVSLKLDRTHAAAHSHSVTLSCKKAIGFMLGIPEFDTTPIFYIEQESPTLNIVVNIIIDNQDRTLRQSYFDVPLQGQSDPMMQSGAWGTFFQQGETRGNAYENLLKGPFSHKLQTLKYGDREQQMTLVGNKEELAEFTRLCCENTTVQVTIDAQVMRCLIPSPHFYEILYNRLANDLALYSPHARDYNILKRAKNSQYPNTINIEEPQFKMCTSISVPMYGLAPLDDGSVDDDDDRDTLIDSLFKSNVNGIQSTRNSQCSKSDFCLLLNVRSVSALVNTKEHTDKRDHQISLTGDRLSLFVVAGLGESNNTACFYTTVQKANIYHVYDRTLFHNVTQKTFARDLKKHDRLITTDEAKLRPHIEEANFAVALKIEHRAKSRTKEVTVAVAIRNSVLRITDENTFALMHDNELCLTRLKDFFNAVDYPVQGYEMPRFIAKWSVQAQNLSSEYTFEHVASLVSMCLCVDNAYVSGRMAAHAEQVRLFCMLDDARLYLAKTPLTATDMRIVHFDHTEQPTMKQRYVLAAKLGFFDLEVSVLSPAAKKHRQTTLLSVSVINDCLHIHMCADTLAATITIIKQLAIKLNTGTGTQDVTDDITAPVEQQTMNASSTDPGEKVQFTPELHEQLQAMVKSAIGEDSCFTNDRQEQENTDDGEYTQQSEDLDLGSQVVSELGDAMQKPEKSRFADEMATPRGSLSDEDFCIVDEIPGSGVLSFPTNEPRVRWLLADEVNNNDWHVPLPSALTDVFTTLPNDYPPPLIRWLFHDISLVLHFYGGVDFDENVARRAYSVEMATDPLARNVTSNRESEQIGVNRDLSVQVELCVNKLSFLYELFVNAPAVSRIMLLIQDVEALNKLKSSRLHKILHQYTSEAEPKRTCAPMASLRLLETSPNEFKCSTSLLPLKINMDQDTLEFLHDFQSDLTAVLMGRRYGEDAHFKMKRIENAAFKTTVKGTHDDEHTLTIRPPPTSTAIESFAGNEDSQLSSVNRDLTPEQQNELTRSLVESMQESTATLAILFDKKNTNESEKLGVSVHYNANSTEEDSRTPSPHSMPSSKDEIAPVSDNQDEVSRELAPRQEGDAYIYSLVFSPACPIRIDYEGNARIGSLMHLGTLPAILLALSQLNCTKLELKPIHHRHGLLGFERCVAFLLDEWITDIRKKQIPSVVGSVGPLSAVTQIFSGMRDLILMPFDEYRRGADGHIAKGMQRGAVSFGTSTAGAAVQLAQNIVSLVQGTAEFAYDLCSPSNSYRRALSANAAPSTDLRSGLNAAALAWRLGMRETIEQLNMAVAREKASGKYPIRGVLRYATPTALRQVVLASQASSRVLQAVQNQLQPERRYIIQDKYKA